LGGGVGDGIGLAAPFRQLFLQPRLHLLHALLRPREGLGFHILGQLETGVLVDPDSESALSVRPALPLKTVAEGADAAGGNME